MRECGGCTLCCDLLEVPVLGKKAGERCAHCVVSSGCSIYKSRPNQCIGFDCLWLSNDLPNSLWPGLCGVLFESFPDEKIVVAMVDPNDRTACRRDAPRNLISTMLEDGFSVWVVIGDERQLVLPTGTNEEEAGQRAMNAWRRREWQFQATQPI